MRFEDCKEYYDTVIKKYYEELKLIDTEQFGGKVLSFREWRLNLFYYFYECFRKRIRKLYMSEESSPMDRHKIAANVLCSLLKAKIIKVNRLIPNLPIELLLANEYLSFYCALNIIELYKIDKIQKEYYLILPETYIEGEGATSYVENVCKALYYSKKISLNDVFSFANILFLLEKYTDTLLEQKE